MHNRQDDCGTVIPARQILRNSASGVAFAITRGLLTEAVMSAPVRRRAVKATPKNSDLRDFLKMLGVRRGVAERASRHSVIFHRPDARRQPARPRDQAS